MTTLTGIEVLARLIAKQPVDRITLPPEDLLARIVGQVVNRNGQEPLAAFQTAITDHPDAELLRYKDVVFGRRLSDDEVYSPELPDILATAYGRATPVFRFLSSLDG